MRLRQLFPWGSLVLGIASALLMDRRPERAWLVVAAIGVGWLGVLAFAVAARLELDKITEKRRAAARAFVLTSRLAALSPVQFALFFTLPFYWRAWAHTAPQGVFIVLLGGAAAVTLWDPWHEALARRPLLGASLQGLASFAGMSALLPLFGLSNVMSLVVAALLTALVLPLLAASHAAPAVRRIVLWRVVPLALLFPLVALVGRGFIPPAPLHLVQGGIGTSLVEHELSDAAVSFGVVPSRLVCASAVAAPRGLRDALVHVWRHDGALIDRISVSVSGGRDAGYRTYSVKQNLGPAPRGVWSCTVETTSGQLLGEVRARID